jgi:hypothetical protein
MFNNLPQVAVTMVLIPGVQLAEDSANSAQLKVIKILNL